MLRWALVPAALAYPQVVAAADWASISDQTLIFDASGQYAMTGADGMQRNGTQRLEVHLYVDAGRKVHVSFAHLSIDGQEQPGGSRPGEVWDLASGHSLTVLDPQTRMDSTSTLAGDTLTTISHFTMDGSLAIDSTDTYVVTLAPDCRFRTDSSGSATQASGRIVVTATLAAESCTIASGKQ